MNGERVDMSQNSSCDYSLSQFKDEECSLPVKSENDTESEENNFVEVKGEPDEGLFMNEAADESEEDIPLSKRKKIETDSEDEAPLIARKKAKTEKKEKKKRVKEESDNEDDDDESDYGKSKKKKAKKEPALTPAKVSVRTSLHIAMII